MSFPAVNIDRLKLGAVVVLGLLQAAVIIATVLLLPNLFVPGPQVPELLLVLSAIAVLGAGARWAERVVAESLAVAYVHELRLTMFDNLADPHGTADPGAGVQLVRFSNDLTAVRRWISQGLARGIGAVLFLLGLLAAIALTDAASAVIVGVVLSLGLGLTLCAGVGLERVVAQTRKRRGRLANRIAGTLRHMREVLANGRTDKERLRLHNASCQLGDQQLRQACWAGALGGTSDLTHRAALLAVIAWGVLSPTAAGGAETLAVVAVVAMLSTPVRDLGRVFEYWKHHRVALRRLAPLLNPAQSQARCALGPGPGALTVAAGRLSNGLRVPHLAVAAGRRIALVGSNGAGKSTLLQALAGLLGAAPEVRLDGTPTAALAGRDRRRAIGMVAADSALVDGSVSKNIRYRMPGASARSVHRACHAAGFGDAA